MHGEKPGPREPQTLEAWEGWVDRLIRDAIERGEFDNLPGRGKPLEIEESPVAGGLEVGFGVLKNAGVAPVWIELDKEVRAAKEAIAALEAQIAAAAVEPAPATASGPPAPRRRWWEPRPRVSRRAAPAADPRATERARLRAAYVAAVQELDRRIARFNAAIPRDLWQLERARQPAAEAAGRAFDELWARGGQGGDAVER